MLQKKTYKPGVVSVTSSPPSECFVSLCGIPAAPVGKIKLVLVCTVLESPENLTRTPGLAIAIERLPATAFPVSNQRPGLSVNLNSTSLSPAAALFTDKIKIADE